MIRGGLIGLIYRKMLRLSASELNESAALTLMGNDIETLSERANALLIEAWANSLTVGIAIWMLYAQLGLVFVAPIAMAMSTCRSVTPFTELNFVVLMSCSFHCTLLVHWKGPRQTPDRLSESNAGPHQLYF